jgi:hypothetical protein
MQRLGEAKFRKPTADRDARIDRCLFKPPKLREFCGAADLEGRRCLALLTGNQSAMNDFARLNA